MKTAAVAAAERPAAIWKALIAGCVLPGLGLYYAGLSFAAAQAGNLAFALSMIVALYGPAHCLFWRSAIAASSTLVLCLGVAFGWVTIRVTKRWGKGRSRRRWRDYALFVAIGILVSSLGKGIGDLRGVQRLGLALVADSDMSPTLVDGDVLVIDRSVSRHGGPVRDAVVAFTVENDENTAFGRVIAVRGETITLASGDGADVTVVPKAAILGRVIGVLVSIGEAGPRPERQGITIN